MMLLVCAGLLIQTMMQLRKVNPGFETDHLLTMNIAVPGARYPENENVRLFFDEVLERLQSMQGVRSAGVVRVLPLSGNFDGRSIEIEGRPVPRGREQDADMYVATPGYLRAMHIPVLKGRGITEQDKPDSQQIALISHSMAKQLWPKQDPIGKRIRLASDGKTPWMTIVGIVSDVSQYALEEKPPLQFYLPFDQFPTRFNNLVIKTSGDPGAILKPVRSAILSVDKDQAVFNVMTMDDLLDGSVSLKHFLTILLVAFSVLAVLLAAIGFYGVMSYAVTQRQQEIGIRMALGATRRQIGRLIVQEAMKLTLIGLFLGSAGAAVTIRLLIGLLFPVSTANPLTFFSVGTLLIAVAITSCLVPAFRAMNVAPAISLRNE